jgi:hypothetical protein
MRRLSTFGTLALLILVLLGTAACGAESPTAPPAPRAPAAPQIKAPAAAATVTTAAAAPAGIEPSALAPALERGATGGAGTSSDTVPPSAAGADEALKLLPGATAAPAASGAAPGAEIHSGQPAPATYQSPLTAGQIDDNARFSEYLDYIHHYQGPQVYPLPVEQRLFVRVVDGAQHPVAGARVQLSDQGRTVFDGRTMSDGRVLFFPQMAGAGQTAQFDAVISRGPQEVRTVVKAGGAEPVVSLPKLADNSGPVGLDGVFLLDATGSMGDEIDQIKGTVNSIASRIEQVPGSSPPRFGLVAYRDRGDDYVTRSWDFVDTVSQFAANLANVQAGGGGDTPESVNAGLHDAIHLPGWASADSGRHLRLIVLVGDAAPHLDYANDYQYTGLLQEAVQAGIKIFPIGASGLDDQGEYIFRQFAEVTQGQFVFLTYENGVSGAPGVSTDHHVSNFTVSQLDTLIVNLVAGEIANQTGQRLPVTDPAPAPVPVGVVHPAPVAPPAWLTAWAGLRDAVAGLVQDGSTVFWLLVILLVAVWMRRAPARARRTAPPSVPFAAPTAPDTEAPPTRSLEGSAARVTLERTTNLPAAVTVPPAAPLDAYLSVEPGARRTAPLPPLPTRVVERPR